MQRIIQATLAGKHREGPLLRIIHYLTRPSLPPRGGPGKECFNHDKNTFMQSYGRAPRVPGRGAAAPPTPPHGPPLAGTPSGPLLSYYWPGFKEP